MKKIDYIDMFVRAREHAQKIDDAQHWLRTNGWFWTNNDIKKDRKRSSRNLRYLRKKIWNTY
jgi:hypothetical protein